MLRERIKRVMGQTFNVPADRVPDDAALADFANWTSLGHLELMMALEMEFAVNIPAQMMLELLSLDAIEEYLTGQGMAAA
jgi:acyl carrier protein